jgi:hypothetical protein
MPKRHARLVLDKAAVAVLYQTGYGPPGSSASGHSSNYVRVTVPDKYCLKLSIAFWRAQCGRLDTQSVSGAGRCSVFLDTSRLVTQNGLDLIQGL